MHITTRTKIGLAAVAVIGAVGASALAQGLGPSPSGSLSELTAEVRQLRMVIQDAGRNQTQMQALNISLTAQHSRLTQVNSRLDAVTDELNKATEKSQAAAKGLLEIQTRMADPSTTAGDRIQYEEFLKNLKYQSSVAVEQESVLRTRQMELLNSFRQEEARWMELVGRLEAILKR
jgi:hypothetical protein